MDGELAAANEEDLLEVVCHQGALGKRVEFVAAGTANVRLLVRLVNQQTWGRG